MQANKNRVTKEIIIQTTLRLIDENVGIKNVTLRDIAKKTGCAHTNLYNYFTSLDDIFWEALGQVLLMMIDYCDTGLNNELDERENFYLFLSKAIDFLMNHPGWYKLIGLESLGGIPSPEVDKILHMPSAGLTQKIMEISKNEITQEEAFSVGYILTCYVQGELSLWLNNRRFTSSKEETKLRILSNLKQLYQLYIQ